MGAFTIHIFQHVTDPDEFWAAHADGLELQRRADLHSRHTAHRGDDGTSAVFIDEHESTAANHAFHELMTGTDVHDRLMGASELERVFVTGDPDEDALAMIAQFGGSHYETVARVG